MTRSERFRNPKRLSSCWLNYCCYIVFCLILLLGLVYGHPPPPIVCVSGNGCTVSNSYGMWNDRTPCQAAAVVYPETEKELLAAVAGATKRKQKMKVVTKWSHSIPKWACPGGAEGLLISTENYDKNIIVDKRSMTVTVDSGVCLRDLIDTIAESGLALPHSPYWEGVTIGGLLSTGSHGSSLFGKGSAVHEYVSQMKLVVPAEEQEGYAKVVILTEKDEDLKAAKVSLGVLGVISQITLQLQPLFKRSITNIVEDDSALEDKLLHFAMAHEFGDITWHPSQYKVVYRKDDRVPVDTPGNGVNDFIGFRGQQSLVLNAVRETEVFFEMERNAEGKCLVSKAQVVAMLDVGNGLKNDNGSFTHYPVIGYQHRMQASGSCLNTKDKASHDGVCGWDPSVNGLFFYESAFLLNLGSIQDFIKDVKKLREIKGAKRFCGTDLYSGLLMRWVKQSHAYLGVGEDVVEVNFNYYKARGEEGGSVGRLDEDVWEEIEQMARYKYGGRPAWSKNRDWVFQGVHELYDRIHDFRASMARLDGHRLFSSEWSDYVLGIIPTMELLHGSTTTSSSSNVLDLAPPKTCLPSTLDSMLPSPHVVVSPMQTYAIAPLASCALDGLCICSVNVHCSPLHGYFCRLGLVYNLAHVCRHQLSQPYM